MTPKEILAKIKAVFDTAPAPPAQAPVNPAPSTGATVSSYNVDGGGAVFVDNSDDGVADIDAGDKVYSDPGLTVPYPDGTYTVTGTQFGFTVAAGSVAAVNDPTNAGPGAPVSDPNAMQAPVTAAVPPPPTMEQRVAAIEAMLGKLTTPAAPGAMAAVDAVPLTPESVQAMYAKFGAGSTEERFTNIETMLKALMECNFGYQIRQGLENAAVDAYKNSVANSVASLVASSAKFDSHLAIIEAQEIKIKKQDELIKGFFELAENLVKEPTTDPKTINGLKKERFDRASKVDRYAGVLEGLKELRKENA